MNPCREALRRKILEIAACAMAQAEKWNCYKVVEKSVLDESEKHEETKDEFYLEVLEMLRNGTDDEKLFDGLQAEPIPFDPKTFVSGLLDKDKNGG